MAAVLGCGLGALLSHRDAAARWGLIDATQGSHKTAELRLAGYEVLRLTYTMVARRPQWALDTVRTMRARAARAL